MSKKKLKHPPPPTKLERQGEKVMRLAHEILTKKIVPANLTLDDAIDVVNNVIKAIIFSSTQDDDLDARSEMIEWTGDRLIGALMEIDPYADEDDEDVQPHAWIIAPQGLITEPVGIMWNGVHEEGSVNVLLGAELTGLRDDLVKLKEEGVHVIEGVNGVAMIDPEWNGSPTVPCANPQCDNVHDAHLLVAENLYTQAKQERAEKGAPN